MSTSTETIEELATREYKYGFVTDVEAETIPKGLSEDVVRADLAEEGRAGVAARVAPEGVPHLADDEGADLAERQVRPDRLPGHRLLLGAEEEEGAEQPRRGRSRGARDVRQARAFRSRSRSCWPASRWTRCSTASRWRRRSARSWRSMGIIFCRSPRRCSEHPELVKKYLGSVVPHTDNFFAALNSAVFSDGSFVYIPKGVRCPMELSTYFRINAKDTGPVRADADHRRRGRVRQLPRRLHGADARREPAARRGRRAGRARRRDDQVLDGPELVSRATRTARAASTTS